MLFAPCQRWRGRQCNTPRFVHARTSARVRCGRGKAWQGVARRGKAWQGVARRGSAAVWECTPSGRHRGLSPLYGERKVGGVCGGHLNNGCWWTGAGCLQRE